MGRKLKNIPEFTMSSGEVLRIYRNFPGHEVQVRISRDGLFRREHNFRHVHINLENAKWVLNLFEHDATEDDKQTINGLKECIYWFETKDNIEW